MFCFCGKVTPCVVACVHTIFSRSTLMRRDSGDENDVLKPGTHAIMSLDESSHPSTIRSNIWKTNGCSKPLFRIVIFYWPVKDAFDIDACNFGIGGIDRSNVSCLYLRTLHELCDCVLIESSMDEVELYICCSVLLLCSIYFAIVLFCFFFSFV